MKELDNVHRFKLLTPARGGAFQESVLTAREASEQTYSGHVLNERIVFSYLAYCSRYSKTESVRSISMGTGLHHLTVKNAIAGLAGAVVKTGAKWGINDIPTEWFAKRSGGGDCEYPYDQMAYIMFYVPGRAAVINYEATNRRFGTNHAAVASLIINKTRSPGGVIHNFTCAGAGQLLSIGPKTVRSVIDDLNYSGFIKVCELGRSFEITLCPLTEKQTSLFSVKPPKPVAKPVHAVEKQPRTAGYKYEMRGDGYDEQRQLCKKWMPQNLADQAIRIAIELGDDEGDFESQLLAATNQHAQNQLDGKVGKGHVGKYFVKRMQTRLRALLEKRREADREAQVLKYMSSPEWKAKRAQEEKIAETDPSHPAHMLTDESILSRVRFDGNSTRNRQKLATVQRRLANHCQSHVQAMKLPTQERINKQCGLRTNIMKKALMKLNHYYNQAERATGVMLETAIDQVLVEEGMAVLFKEKASAEKEVTHV